MQRKRGFTRVPWWDHDPSPTIVLTYIATFNLAYHVPAVRCLHFSRKNIIHGLT